MPIRMCAVCKSRMEKRELYRIVENEGEIRLDKDGKAQRRGLYVCADCLPLAEKKRVLERAFRRKVSGDIYLKILTDAGYDR